MANHDPDSAVGAAETLPESAAKEAKEKDEFRDLDISDDEGALVKGGIPTIVDGGT